MNKFRLILRIIWLTAIFLAVICFIYWAIIPGGKITYIKDFKHYSDFIGNLTPSDRVKDNDMIIGDPAYFSLRLPRRFVNAKATIKYKIDPLISIVELGVLKDNRTWQYDLQPLYNAKLESLMQKWDVIREGDLMLLQKNKKFNSIADFLKDTPDLNKVALYNYDLNNNYILPAYQPSKATTTMCRPLQGAYQFYTYIKNEKLSFDFSFQDLNKISGADPIDVYVYYQGEEIYNQHLDDDGIVADNGEQKAWRNLKVELADLPEGVYEISLGADNDIVTRTIATTQSKMTFINKISLADAPEVSCGLNFFTNSRQLSVRTSSSDRLGEIKINQASGSAFSEILKIDQPYQQFETKADLPEFSKVTMPSGGIDLSGDGLFSSSQESFINPKIKKIDNNFEADREGVEYILARYTPAVHEGDWLASTANFDLQTAYKEFNKHSFIISIPGLKAEKNNSVEVKEIKFELSGTSFFEKIKKIFNVKF